MEFTIVLTIQGYQVKIYLKEALKVKQKRDMMALNVELRINDNSECQNENATLNVKMKTRL